ncbi:iron ABC transporter substrate-binding protein [Desulfitobacterium chlororespirans]|uniref:Iron complex transport system substrate-binding protein n=1 Tax=Desulfitobacterium chlororespirans DSM 11544 TaxID=1121395 RepID=A0A1M7S4W7_9FIRM|nr:iron ABC transporter substrate-binding protein [Desulfitobacterium chlororespirans]SHN53342.1 iron complex transport system substrate-binding protein [Desulfitobacterium chlororespirans DSM 11544]
MKKWLLFLMIPMLILIGCTNQVSQNSDQTDGEKENDTEKSTQVITDMMGREVEIPTKIDSIICTGAGALRLITYAQAVDLVIGIEDTDKSRVIGRPYNYVYHDQFKDLPSIGKGGGRGYTAYEEQIIALQPDVIFCSYTSDALDQLAAKTGIPVVSTAIQGNLFEENTVQSLKLIGEILGKEERCAEVITYLDQYEADLSDRTKDIPEADKPTVYVGAISNQGGRGFAGTYGGLGPLKAINVSGVADEVGKKEGFEVDWEQIQVWDPDYIFLDPGNINLVNEEYNKKPDYFNSLRAVKEGNVYSIISFNNYTTNIEMAIADAYYAGKVLFPGKFADLDIETKTEEIFKNFLGKGIYSEMKEVGLTFGKITLGQ